ncbi:hypothetical protein Gura_0162 [Geotalea uraniireducens Rf4]|uniref:DNA methylase adenine-specific domain-containing protein n=1 Tax=Geotalea uraniireducens (strain Rf4) TaxID=351605 RepID=A5GDH8_GEOUR|nr:hypothetical protein Gura_0162 [Geotalea uraniireducens Rf4]
MDEVIGVPHASAMRIGFNKLNLSGFFCIDTIPTIAFLSQERINRLEITRVHNALWNQGLVSLLLVTLPDEVRAYSLARKPTAADEDLDDDKKDNRLIDCLDLLKDALEISHLITGVESGRYFQKNKEYFAQNEKIDALLLSNLRATENELTSAPLNLSTESAQALLLQITFIAYLEDRGIIDPDYFREALKGKGISTLEQLLDENDPENLNSLFEKLHGNFNGDIFFAPCAFDGEAKAPVLNAGHLRSLAEFRKGGVDKTTGQGRFWPYNFKYIPVELISAIYNRFLGDRPVERKVSGAFYTPHFLADLTVNQLWEELTPAIRSSQDFTVLDPACGSAIFLVRIFQRMVEDWRFLHPGGTPDWDTLVAIVERLNGWDKETSAVRIGIFSLYIALLEEVEPAAILKLLAERKLLPPLFRKTMCDRDFFGKDTPNTKFDLVFGNPPWVSRKEDQVVSATEWCKAHELPMPAKELAWAFVWKSIQHTKSEGMIGLLLPAMGVLLNHSEPSIQARGLWLKQVLLSKVINFSDICFLLFDGAKRPTALCIFRPSDKKLSDYRFDYWCPKADPLLQQTRMLTLNRGDKLSFKLSTVLHDPGSWGRHLWMTNRDMKLLGWIGGLSRLERKLATYKESQQKEFDKKTKVWIIGQGFQPYNSERSNKNTKPKKSNRVEKVPFLDANKFNEYIIPTILIDKPWHTSLVRRLGNQDGFIGPHVLIPKGVRRKTGLLRAAYVEHDLCFTDAIQAINFPETDIQRLKLLTVILNSHFAAWFYFHETASLGADRALVHEEQLLALPFPEIDELPDPKAARNAADKIVMIFDDLLLHKDTYSQGQFPDNETIEEVNRLVYQYYGLTESEFILIEDTLNYILPSIQPRNKSFPHLWNKAGKKQWQEYMITLLSALEEWLDNGSHLSATLITDNPDVLLLGLKIEQSRPKQSITFCEQGGDFNKTLSKINEELKQQVSRNIQLMPDLRIFIADTLYLLKPRTMRYWLKSTALNDADAIIADLQIQKFHHGYKG